MFISTSIVVQVLGLHRPVASAGGGRRLRHTLLDPGHGQVLQWLGLHYMSKYYSG